MSSETVSPQFNAVGSLAPRIYLVGFMGAGKTTIGRQMARLLGWVFLDLDREIEMESGMKVARIFERHGEEFFRELESKQLAETLQLDSVIVATGGGAYASPRNIDAIRSGGGITVWLDVAFSDLLARLHRHDNQRPLFKDDCQASALFESRRPFYSQADYAFNLDGTLSPRKAARRIIQRIHPEMPS